MNLRSIRKGKVMKKKTTHTENLVALRRIEGQVRGIQRMIEDEKYCIDVINQIHAASNALYTVSAKIFMKHIENCVVDALHGKSEKEKLQKINEVMSVIKKLQRLK